LGEVVVRTPEASSTARNMWRWSAASFACVLTPGSVRVATTPPN
jgi:hypothetical protein